MMHQSMDNEVGATIKFCEEASGNSAENGECPLVLMMFNCTWWALIEPCNA